MHAAVRAPGVAAVVAICPAQAGPLSTRAGAWAASLEVAPAVSRADGIARGYWHATGDEVVPWGATMDLMQRTHQPKRLRVVLGGHHRSLQHDPGVMADTVAFLAAHL
ncbi:MAG: hypothetical protein U0Y82_07805 [Thermoleophilia bacterium]